VNDMGLVKLIMEKVRVKQFKVLKLYSQVNNWTDLVIHP
jgi:hypothetical protein